MPSLPTAAVIGAGSSGIAAAKALHERGIPFTCFEASDRVGGNWVFGNTQRDVGGLPLAAHQHLARADGVLGLPDAEVLSGLPAPHADRRVLRRLRRPLRLPRPRSASRRSVERAARRADGGWELTLDDGVGRALRRAARRQRPPLGPALARAGVPRPRHASPASRCTRTTTVDDDLFADKRVVVLGMGNSRDGHRGRGVLRRAQRRYLAARRGAWIIPKYMFGTPGRPAAAATRASRSRSASG